MESRVLPEAEIAAILASKFVCVKINIDNPDGASRQLLDKVQGNILPFFAYAGPDGKFISGTSGFRDAAKFKADLEAVLANPALRVPPEVEKKLAKLAEQAAKDAEAGKVAALLKTAKTAEGARGFSESKDKILELRAKAVESGRAKIQEAADLCKDGKFEEAAGIVSALSREWKGGELEKPLAAAAKGVDRLKGSAKDPTQAKRLCELIVKECKDAPPFVEAAEAKLKD
jgi:hypothetical protein